MPLPLRRENPSTHAPMAYGEPLSKSVATGAAALVTGTRTVLARADLAYFQSIILRTHSKGNLGERLAERLFLRSGASNWISLTPRYGRQGIDHLFLRVKPNGTLSWIVGESKYGSSRLGATTDGATQMSWVWIHKRTDKIADTYLSLADRKVTIKKLPCFKSRLHCYDIPVDGGKTKVTFWRDGRNWYFSGTEEQLSQAREMATKMGLDLKSPMCDLKGRRFHIVRDGDNVKITIDEINSAPGEKTIVVRQGKPITIKNVLGRHISDRELKAELAEELQRNCPNLSKKEVMELAEDLARKYKNGMLLEQPARLLKSIGLQSLYAAGIAGVIDAGIQFATRRKVALGHVLLVATASGVGTAGGQLVTIGMLKTKVGTHCVRVVARLFKLRCSSMLRTSIAGSVGAGITTAVLSYGSALMGYSTWKEANREMLAGGCGILAGGATSAGVMTLVSMFGTTSTGVAISGLSGAASSNAILACLGGGAVSAGGGGVMVGTMVLGGIVTIVTVAVTTGIMFGFVLYDEKKQREFLFLLKKRFDDAGLWLDVSARCSNRQAGWVC